MNREAVAKELLAISKILAEDDLTPVYHGIATDLDGVLDQIAAAGVKLLKIKTKARRPDLNSRLPNDINSLIEKTKELENEVDELRVQVYGEYND